MNKPFAIVNGLYNLFETSTNELGKKFYVTTQLSDDAKSLYPNVSEDTIFYIKTDMLDSSIGYNGLYVYTHNNLISNYENDNEFIQTGLINSILNESKVFLIGNISPLSINTPWSISFHLEAYSLLSSFNSEFDINLYGITNGDGSKLVSYTVLNANGEKPPFKYHVFKSDIDSGLFGLCIGDTENNNNPNATRNIRMVINSHTNCTIEPIDPIEVMPTLDECTIIPADKTGFVTENAESGHIYNASIDSLAEGIKTEFVINGETQHLDSPVANGTRSHAEGASMEIDAFSNCSWPVNGDYTKFTCDIQSDELYKAQIISLVGTNIVWNNIKRTFVSIEFITNNNQEIGLVTINEPFSESPETEQEILIYSGITNGMASHIEGINYIGENGILSHAEGMGNIISTGLSHVEGQNNTITSTASHVEGLFNLSKGDGSHIEGAYNVTNGNYSHIEGQNNITSNLGQCSHAEGCGNIVDGTYSHVEGYYNKTTNNAEHAEGQFNVSNTGKTIHSIGIGTNNDNRKNALEITIDGSAYLHGVGNYNGTSIGSNVKTLQESIVTANNITAATTVGYISKNTNIPAGTSIDDFVNMIFNPVLGVTVQLPSISITSSPEAKRYEIGQQITVNLSNTYSDGKFIPIDNWDPSINAGCTVSGDPVYYRNGITLSGSTDVQSITSAGLNYYVTQQYNKSTVIPKNNRGENLIDVSIAAGSTQSPTITFSASYKYFVGGTTSLTSASGPQIRLLDSSGFITANTVSIPGEIEINKNQYMIIACPSTYKLLNVDGGMAGISITNDFNSSYGINGIARDDSNSYVVYYLYNNGDNAKFLNIKIDKKTL